MNEALTITGAIFAVLTALIFNRKDVSDLRAKMKQGNASLKMEIRENNASLRAELKETIAELRTEMQAGFAQLNTRMDRMQGDMNTFAIVSAVHDQRIAALESATKA
jgi:hypothetical protein